MPTATAISPEELLIAVLHKVGSGTRIISNLQLSSLFDKAAQSAPELFGAFSAHPQYRDSKLLRDTLQALDLGGAIVRENASTKYFRVAPRTTSTYGANAYNELTPEEKAKVDTLAESIRRTYTS